MKIILLQDVKGVGKINTVCSVKDGYATNYLIPKGMAVYYNDKTELDLEKKLAKLAQTEAENRAKAEEVKSKIEALSLQFALKTNHGIAFGAVSQKQIVEKLKENGINIAHTAFEKQIKLILGEYTIPVKVYKDIVANLKVEVIAQ